MELDDNEDEDLASVVSSHSRSISESVTSTNGKVKAKADPEEEEEPSTKPRPAKRQRARTTKKRKEDEEKMNVDPPLPTPVYPSPKSPCRKSTTKAPSSLAKSNSKPRSTASATTKPKSAPLQRSPLFSSFTAGSTDVIPALPRPDSPTRKVRVEVEMLTTTAGRKGLTKGSMGSLKKRTSAGSIKVDSNAKPRVGNKPKALDEIVDTSVDGEMEFT